MFIANAPIPVSSDSNVELILISAAAVVIAGIMAFVPIRIAKSRGRRKVDRLIAVLVLWALASAGSVGYSVMRQMDWSVAYQQRLSSGYGDPSDLSDKPAPPVVLWSGFAVVYVLAVVWAGRPASQHSSD